MASVQNRLLVLVLQGFNQFRLQALITQKRDRQCAGDVPKLGAECFDFLSRRCPERANPIEILEPEHQQLRLLLRGDVVQCEFVNGLESLVRGEHGNVNRACAERDVFDWFADAKDLGQELSNNSPPRATPS
jgi:hypothetical protein